MKNNMLQMLKLAFVFWLTTSINTVFSQSNCSELFFSEYIEGSGLNKGLEIYNPSMNTIDLSNYSVKVFSNGSSNAGITIPLTGMLEGDSVFVVTHSGANMALKSHADLTTGTLTFNGDDAVALVSTTDTVDVIGVIGTDPGSAWSNGGLSTKDQTLLRNSTVQIGIGPDSANFNPSIEWTGLAQNDFSNIGTHTSSCPRCTSDTTQLTDAICQGDNYTFNGQSITTAGVYYDTLQNVGGCDSLLVLTLTVNPNPTIVANSTADTICQGSSVTLSAQGGNTYLWDNNVTDGVAITPNASTMFTVVGQDANGCLGIDSTEVVVETAATPTISIVTPDSMLCEGEGTNFSSIVTNAGQNASYQWKRNGNNVGTGLVTYTSQSSSTNNGDVISCELTTTGVCGTTVISNVITISVTPNDSTDIADTICTGDSVVLGSQTLTSGGVYTETFTNMAGCDSVVTLTLVENQLPTVLATTTADTICQGGSVTLTGQGAISYSWTNGVTDGIAFTPNQTGSYIVTGMNANGCLGLDTVEIVISNDSIPTIQIMTPDSMLCEGEGTNFSSIVTNAGQNASYQWKRNGNNVGTGLASYTSQSLSTNNGDVISCELTTTGVCGTTVVSNAITISVTGVDSVSINETICSNDSIVFGSQVLATSGTYMETFANMAGCDSVVTLELVVNQAELIPLNDTICEGEVYQFANMSLTQTGTYFDTLQTTTGCDSIVMLELYARPTEIITQNSFLCTGDSIAFGNVFYNTSGTYIDTLTSLQGCDSISILELIVGGTDTLQVSDIICSSDSLIFGNQILTQTGIYTEVFASTGGCDSIVTMELEVIQATSSFIADTICANDSIEFGGQMIAVSGVYFDTILNTAGCDSVIEFNLTVLPQMIDTLTQTICSGDSVLFGGVMYSQTGLYQNSLQSQNGCDSLIVLDLVVMMPVDTTINESICNGSSFAFGTQTITQPGTYTEVFQSVYGCDSTVVAIVGLGNSSDTSVVEEICQGDYYSFGSQVLTQTGTYTETFTNVSGCDSTVILTLSVKANPIVSITLSGEDLICTQGDAYQWFFNGDTIPGATNQSYTPTENGIYTVNMTAFNGCSDQNNYTIQNVSVTEFTVSNVIIAPNPSNGIYTVSSSIDFDFKVYNLLGELMISSSTVNSIQYVDITPEENGVYLLVLTTKEGEQLTERIIKK